MTTEMKKTLKIWVLTAIGSVLLMTVIFGIAFIGLFYVLNTNIKNEGNMVIE